LLKSDFVELFRFAYSLGEWVDLQNYVEHWSAELCRFANSLGECHSLGEHGPMVGLVLLARRISKLGISRPGTSGWVSATS